MDGEGLGLTAMEQHAAVCVLDATVAFEALSFVGVLCVV